MPDLISRRNLDFVLYELLEIESLCNYADYAGHDRQTFDGVIEAAAELARCHFEPHVAIVDEHEPEFQDGNVHVIPEVGEALDQYYSAGFGAASFPEDIGGMQLPFVVETACQSLFLAGNVSTASYPVLTKAAANLLNTFGSATQKGLYLRPMLEGRFFGTMCLTEPHAGSSLADIRTRAELDESGTFRITGAKMWISAGDHSLSENIVHMVLARIPGGAEGIKGISLFIVPKYAVNGDGSLGERNDITVTGINHKMGYRGTVNTALNFGERGACVGYLMGEPHRGIEYMFHMMNESRIAVGLGATAIGYAGYLHSLHYAEERPQGRKPDNTDPSSPPVRIIEHADIKRLLLAQKTYVEGALALMLFCAHLVDRQRTGTESDRRDSMLLLGVLTPIAKSWPAEFCLEANKHAIQVLGGYGYSREYPVERLYRDNRLNAIHEGTQGIQAIDLLGRKVMGGDGEAFDVLLREIRASIETARILSDFKEHAEQLDGLCIAVEDTTARIRACIRSGHTERALANATLYLDAVGHLVVAWLWLQQGIIASQAITSSGSTDRSFYQGKLRAAEYFFRYELPHALVWLDVAGDLDETCLGMPNDCF